MKLCSTALPTHTQASSPSAKGHFNLLAGVLWAHTMAADRVKHAECVGQKRVMISDVCVHFATRGTTKASFPADTTGKHSSCTAPNQAVGLPAGEDCGPELITVR